MNLFSLGGLLIFFCVSVSVNAYSMESLRVFSWDGYVTETDLKAVNQVLKQRKINVKVELISPLAEGPEQMFNIIRAKECDIAFFTLFFIKMKKEVITKLLQPINLKSKNFTNLKDINPDVLNLKMGMKNGDHLYVPFGGGVYGFWANMDKVKESEVPKSFKELWEPRWYKKFSLNKTQIWYNIGITLMAMGHKPFHVNDLILNDKRQEALALINKGSAVQKQLNLLYQAAGNFWSGGTEFKPGLEIVSSWGPEMEKRNQTEKENWKLINFKEGNMVWLDTINFVDGLKGDKLQAAEIFANYFLGKTVQKRVVDKLSMISVSKAVKVNPRVDENPNLFQSEKFVPPYSESADNLMQALSRRAMSKIKLQK